MFVEKIETTTHRRYLYNLETGTSIYVYKNSYQEGKYNLDFANHGTLYVGNESEVTRLYEQIKAGWVNSRQVIVIQT